MANSRDAPADERDERDEPTQVLHPARALLRTLLAGGIAFIPVGTALIRELGLDSVPFFAAFIALGAAITRVMAMSTTEKFLEDWAPWLSAAPYRGRHRAEDKRGTHD